MPAGIMPRSWSMSECADVYLARVQSLTGFNPLDPADGEGGMEASKSSQCSSARIPRE